MEQVHFGICELFIDLLQDYFTHTEVLHHNEQTATKWEMCVYFGGYTVYYVVR